MKTLTALSILALTSLATAKPVDRFYYPSTEDRPAAIQTVFGADESKTLYKALGKPVFAVAYDVVTGTNKKELRIIGAEADKTLQFSNDKTEKFLLSDNRTAKPTFVVRCNEPTAGAPECVAWMWIWPADKLEGPHKDKQLAVKRDGANGAKFLRVDIHDAADAFSFFHRLDVPGQDQLDKRFQPARNRVSKELSFGKDEFTLNCAEWEPRPGKSYSCFSEVRLDGATRVESDAPEAKAADLAMLEHERYLYLQVQAVGVVVQKIVDAKQAADKKLLNDAYRAWLDRQPVSRFNHREGFPMRQYLEALGADNLRIILNDMKGKVR